MADNLERGIMAFRISASSKEQIKTLAYMSAMIATECTKTNIKIVECAITFGGTKSVIAEVKKLKDRKNFTTVLLFNPKSVAKNQIEYSGFISAMEGMGLNVRVLREN